MEPQMLRRSTLGSPARRVKAHAHGPGQEADIVDLLARLAAARQARGRRADLREAVILLHLPVVERLATRFARRGVPRDDLVQAGALGLILAVDRYDPSRGVPFLGYAIPTIVGSMQRYLRDDEPVMRGPRRPGGEVPEVGRRVLLLGGWSLEPILQVRTSGLDPAIEATAERVLMLRHLRSLTPRDRQLLYLRFYEDESLAEIGARMGLSVSRVSRLLSRALTTLRDELDAEEVAG